MRIDWFDISIRHIPHRVLSTTAAVDAQSVAQRPCFLCAGNLPPEEEGMQFDENFTIYWRKPDAWYSDGDNNRWCVKDDKGRWRPFIVEPDD